MPRFNQGIPEFVPIRNKVLNTLLLFMSFGALPLLATSLFNFYTSGWKSSMVVDIVGLLSMPVFYMLRNKISYSFKLSYLILLGLFSGINIFHDYSILGTGIIVLSSVTLITTLFFGMRTGWLMMICDTVVIAFIGYLYHQKYLKYNFDFGTYIHSPLTWFDHVVTFLFFIGIVVIASGLIHRELATLIRQTRNEKEKFKGLFNNIQDAILIYAVDGRILEMNNSLLEMYGIERDSAMDTRIRDFSILTKDNSTSGINVKCQYEIKARRFDNKKEFFIEVMMSPIEYGEEKAILVNIRNITQRKQAEEALRQSEEKYRNLIELSPAGNYIVEADKFLYINPLGARNLGYKTVRELGDKNIFTFVAPECRDIFGQRLKTAQARKLSPPVELKFLKVDGTELWAETVLMPFEYYGTHAVLIMAFDITERKKAESLILQKNKEIENQNIEYALLNEKLKIAKEKAEESDRLKSAFLSNMSHEIRTPMNAILGFSDFLIKDTLTEDKRKEYVDIINNSGKQLLSLINDIIDISKIESNQLVIDYSSEISLNDTFRHLFHIFNARAKSRRITLEYCINLESFQSNVFLDKIRLNQILGNLIGNAIKFTEDGLIRYEVRLEKNELLFSVKDSGIGITQSQQLVIFERFRQADGITSGNYGGTGLGLAISKALVELMGGRIWLESTPGKGTTFYFTLPFRPTLSRIQENGQMHTRQIENSWENKVIVLVEDEDVNILLITDLLKPTGAKVLVAKNAREAYRLVNSNELINLILMDIKIPEVDGYEITRVIKKSHPRIPVIAQTAYALSEERKKIMESGFDDYISKPLEKDIFLNLLSRYLEN